MTEAVLLVRAAQTASDQISAAKKRDPSADARKIVNIATGAALLGKAALGSLFPKLPEPGCQGPPSIEAPSPFSGSPQQDDPKKLTDEDPEATRKVEPKITPDDSGKGKKDKCGGK